MRAYLIFLGAMLSLSNVAIANSDSDSGDAFLKAKHCIKCHGIDGIDLTDSGVEALEATIKSIQAGDTKHPTKLDDLTDEEVSEIAKILNRSVY